jgi:hypothetical protein
VSHDASSGAAYGSGRGRHAARSRRGRHAARPVRKPLRGLTATGLAVLAGVSLSGCHSQQAGAAAIVGDDRITISALEAKVARLAAYRERAGQLPVSSPELVRGQLFSFISGRILDEAAREMGVTVTDTEIAMRRNSLTQRLGGPDQLVTQAAAQGIAPDEIDRFLRDELLQEKIAQAFGPQPRTVQDQASLQGKLNDLYGRVASRLQVSVNPRYGTWDSRSVGITDTVDPWLKPEQTGT